MTIIDTIFLKLGIKNSLLKYLFRPFLSFFKIQKLDNLLDETKQMKGIEFVNFVLEKLNITCEVKTINNIEYVPTCGPCIIIANHPTGLIDGMLLIHAVSRIRQDIKIVGNYLYQDIEKIKFIFDDILIYVNPFDNEKEKQSSHKGIKNILESLNSNKVVILFPSGDISKINFRKLEITDNEWNQTCLKLIYKCQVPTIPAFISIKNSLLFYIFNTISSKLGLIMIFREGFNKSNSKARIDFGKSFKPIEVKDYNKFKLEIRDRVYKLKK